MARRMYDLDNGTDAIIVKDVKVVGTNGFVMIKDNDAVGNYSLSLKSTSEGFNISIDGQPVFTYDDSKRLGYLYFALKLNSYSTSTLPTNLGEGAITYDSDLKKCVLYNGNDWVNLDGTPLGA